MRAGSARAGYDMISHVNYLSLDRAITYRRGGVVGTLVGSNLLPCPSLFNLLAYVRGNAICFIIYKDLQHHFNAVEDI